MGFDPALSQQSKAGSELAECSIHGKRRSVRNLMADGQGGMCCAPGNECQTGKGKGGAFKKFKDDDEDNSKVRMFGWDAIAVSMGLPTSKEQAQMDEILGTPSLLPSPTLMMSHSPSPRVHGMRRVGWIQRTKRGG